MKENELGMVFADSFMTGIKKEISEFCESLYPNGGNYTYERITMPILQLENDNTILLQYNDVILGAIYYSLREMSENFLPKLKSSFHCGNDGKINNNGVNIFPKNQTTEKIGKQVIRVKEKFIRLLN
jgi:hypothetical protein